MFGSESGLENNAPDFQTAIIIFGHSYNACFTLLDETLCYQQIHIQAQLFHPINAQSKKKSGRWIDVAAL